ncbi:CHAD domain-containing protein [Geitlerinema splendidum]|nr:CHAD domain-containing protein [Geitlerinema splendidum]
MNQLSFSLPPTFGDWAHLAIATHFNQTLADEAEVMKTEGGEQRLVALKRMRVGMRRLQTAIAGFDRAIILPKAAQEKQLAQVTQALSNLCELENLQVTLQTHYQPHLPPAEQPALRKVLKKLRKQCKRADKQSHKELRSKRYAKFKAALHQWLQAPAYSPLAPMPIEPILPDLLSPFVSQLFLQPGWLVGIEKTNWEADIPPAIPVKSVETHLALYGHQLHDLCKLAQQVRDRMHLYRPLYGRAYQTCEEDIKQLQAVLSDLQDNLVLTHFVAHVLGNQWSAAAPELTRQLARVRHQAWQAWQTLQHRYLTAQMRSEFYLTILQPGAEESPNGTTPVYLSPQRES